MTLVRGKVACFALKVLADATARDVSFIASRTWSRMEHWADSVMTQVLVQISFSRLQENISLWVSDCNALSPSSGFRADAPLGLAAVIMDMDRDDTGVL